jgi:GNAT superfamily N-acetyltransferase
VKVRIAVETDWPSVSSAFLKAGRSAWRHILAEDALAGLNPPPRWQDGISRGNVFVAEEGRKVIGFVSVCESNGAGEVDGLYVQPEYWGTGAGRALLAAGVEELRRRGHSRAVLWTAAANHRPLRLYEAAGWKPNGVFRDRTLFSSTFREIQLTIDL